MKKLSDYQGEAAIDLWADVMDYTSTIIKDPKVRKKANAPKLELAKTMLKLHKKEVCKIMLRIDETPVNGLNVLVRLVSILDEVFEEPELRSFFGMQSQNEQQGSFGSATENTKENEQ